MQFQVAISRRILHATVVQMTVPVPVNQPGAAVVRPNVPHPVPELVPAHVLEPVPEEDVLAVQAPVWEGATYHARVLAKGHVPHNVRLVSRNNIT